MMKRERKGPQIGDKMAFPWYFFRNPAEHCGLPCMEALACGGEPTRSGRTLEEAECYRTTKRGARGASGRLLNLI